MNIENEPENNLPVVAEPIDNTPRSVFGFIKENPFRLEKFNIQPWGTYEIKMALGDSEQWYAMNDMKFGYEWSMEYAAAQVLEAMIMSPQTDRQMLVDWLGEDRTSQLEKLIKG